MVKTLTFGRIKLVLDSDEIFPDDPGQGTPAMVYAVNDDNVNATYNCARSQGELWNSSTYWPFDLTNPECKWLNEQEDAVWKFIDEHTP